MDHAMLKGVCPEYELCLNNVLCLHVVMHYNIVRQSVHETLHLNKTCTWNNTLWVNCVEKIYP